MARKSLAALVDAELAADPRSDNPGLPESGASVLPENPSSKPPEARRPVLSTARSAEGTESGSSDPPEDRSLRLTEPETPEIPELRGPHLPKSRTTNGRNSGSYDLKDSAPPGVPKYLRLVRKEARLSAEQFDALTDLARRLNRRKPRGVGERITENTLIRVAVDLLLAEAARVQGTTEDELLHSLR